MRKKSFLQIVSAGLIAVTLTGCGSLDNIIPPAPIANGDQLIGPAGNDANWKPYGNGPETSFPPPPSPRPDPNWRSAASAPVRAQPIDPPVRAEPVDPSFSANSTVRERTSELNADATSWGTYSGGTPATRSYSSRPGKVEKKDRIYSPWADRIVSAGDRPGFNKMVMEALRTGGSRLTLMDGKFLSADRMDSDPAGCTTIVVSAANNEEAEAFSKGEATICN